jgi:lipid II:glycine glycyltransferase (peptidoglycan interpeptide bridge formation enzyme)
MQVVDVTDAQSWDRSLLALPNPHVLQSWTWGDFKSRHGWSVTRLLFREGGKTVAAASVLERRVPRLPMSILYVPKGPALDWADASRLGSVLGELEHLARRRGALFLKIDPDIYYPDDVPTFSSRPALAPHVSALLGERGWRPSDDQIQFRNTVLLDLDYTEDELLAAMKQKTRYNVRLARRRGVTVRKGDASDLDTLYRLYAETSERDGFLIRPQSYYLDVWGSFLQEGEPENALAAADPLLADVEGDTVAGLVLFRFGPTAWYMYGASSDRHRRHMPNQLLQWEAIRRAREAGCTTYDLWGAPDTLDESDPMWGVVRFKLGLGGQLAQGMGAWDFPTNRAAYRLYRVAMPRYLNWLRRSSGGRGSASYASP